jgi:hypothetical protein
MSPLGVFDIEIKGAAGDVTVGVFDIEIEGAARDVTVRSMPQQKDGPLCISFFLEGKKK